jgi:ketosteroid isomerase-like protein
MKLFAILIISVLIGLTASPAVTRSSDDLQQQIVAKEREELDALKSGDIAAVANLIADEAVFLNARGPSPKADVVKHVADFKLLDYTIEDVRFVPVGPKTGLIVYKLTQKGSSNGREFAGKANISALWTEREGKWVCLFSQETPTK